FKRTFTEPYPPRMEKQLSEAGVVAIHGRARFVNPNSVEVAGEVLEAKHIAIAAGARPATLGIPGEKHLITSEQFLDLNELPHSMVFVGGGYIAFEFANIAARAGSQVTILHRGKRPLELFDPDLVDRLVVHMRSIGIDVQLNSPVSAVERPDAGVLV